MFLNSNIFFQFEFYCSNLLDMRNLPEQAKKHSVTKTFSDLSLFELKNFENSCPSALSFKSVSLSLEHFLVTKCHWTIGQKMFVCYAYLLTNWFGVAQDFEGLVEATCTDSVAEFECASVEVVVVAVEYDAELFHPWPEIEWRNSNKLLFIISDWFLSLYYVRQHFNKKS